MNLNLSIINVSIILLLTLSIQGSLSKGPMSGANESEFLKLPPLH